MLFVIVVVFDFDYVTLTQILFDLYLCPPYDYLFISNFLVVANVLPIYSFTLTVLTAGLLPHSQKRKK